MVSFGSECIAFMDLCENSNEPSGFIKDKKCLAMSEWLSASRKKKRGALMCEVIGGKWIIRVLEKQSYHSLITIWWHINWQVNIFTHQHEMVWFMDQRWILNVYIILHWIWSVMMTLYTIFVLLKEKQQYAWICSPCTISIFLHVSF